MTGTARAKMRVLLADDHPILLAGLRRLLEPEFDVVGLAGDGREAVQQTAALHPDAVVLDVSMPKLSGIEVARALRRLSPATAVIFLTMHADPALAAQTLREGASAYVLKQSAVADLSQALHLARDGGRFVSSTLGRVIDRVGGDARPPAAPEPGLTPRQVEVLRLVAGGLTLKEIADRLGLSVKTAEFHKYRLMALLDLHTTAELTAFAIRHGIVDGGR